MIKTKAQPLTAVAIARSNFHAPWCYAGAQDSGGQGISTWLLQKWHCKNSEAMVAMDMPAGPSEVLIIADQTASPAHVAADLLSQAETRTWQPGVTSLMCLTNLHQCSSDWVDSLWGLWKCAFWIVTAKLTMPFWAFVLVQVQINIASSKK